MRSAILTYHSIDSSGSVISISPAVFQSHLEILATSALPIVPLSEIEKMPGCIAITFDDGFENFDEFAVPLLMKYKFPATVFLVSGYCGGNNDWPTQPPAAPRLPLMGWAKLQRLTGAEIEWGAHTVSHPDLTKLSRQAAAEEIRVCRQDIEQRIGRPVKSFAYPYGAADHTARSLAQEEFDIACGTRLALLGQGDNHWELPRVDAYYLRNPARLRSLLRPIGRGYIAARRTLREARSWLSR